MLRRASFPRRKRECVFEKHLLLVVKDNSLVNNITHTITLSHCYNPKVA